jgi:DNA-directed RNA polymerase specialized sigma24 family protein
MGVPTAGHVISMPSHHSERSLELQGLLHALRPRILELLSTYQVPEERAVEIVHDTFIALAVRWSRVGNRQAWLLGTLEARCRSWADEARAEGPEGREPGAGGGAEGDPDGSAGGSGGAGGS